MTTKYKIKIPNVCPYQFTECTRPQDKPDCIHHCVNTEPSAWKSVVTLRAATCQYAGIYAGIKISNKGWREKYVLLNQDQWDERQGLYECPDGKTCPKNCIHARRHLPTETCGHSKGDCDKLCHPVKAPRKKGKHER